VLSKESPDSRSLPNSNFTSLLSMSSKAIPPQICKGRQRNGGPRRSVSFASLQVRSVQMCSFRWGASCQVYASPVLCSFRVGSLKLPRCCHLWADSEQHNSRNMSCFLCAPFVFFHKQHTSVTIQCEGPNLNSSDRTSPFTSQSASTQKSHSPL
jgi:hypothetical protein